ncbi:MAG: hypothetical protein MMC33_000464 [Icmadophila ericetorum]|nr:hypothetical protein [Icmadophila ericetorum]
MAPAPTASSASALVPLNIVALISGGKDSIYSLLHCLANGHNVVALGNLHPPITPSFSPLAPSDVLPPPDPTTATTHAGTNIPVTAYAGTEQSSTAVSNDLPAASSSFSSPSPSVIEASQAPPEEEEDLNSYMYQTAGHTLLPLYSRAIPSIPLYRAPIVGQAINIDKSYSPTPTSLLAEHDETESLIPLLRVILDKHPEANAISTGAILSTYQRTRIESVALRLGLIPLAWLWQYPILPSPYSLKDRPAGLLRDMGHVGLEARIIKVASGGLDERLLWENLGEEAVRRRIERAVQRFGGEGSVLGEGGEYESLVVDGPVPLWEGRIVVKEEERRFVRSGGGEAMISFMGASVVRKHDMEEGKEKAWAERLRIPSLWDEQFEKLASGKSADWGEAEAEGDEVKPIESDHIVPKWTDWSATISVVQSKSTLTISNITAPNIEDGVKDRLAQFGQLIVALLQRQNCTPNDIIFTTILLRNMSDFAKINAIYGKLFSKPNPPARVTVACGGALPKGANVMMSFVLQLNDRLHRNGLHVQSRSYWAPANIGPYSQAITVKVNETSPAELVFVAGQIPLVPASMEVFDLGNDIRQSTNSLNLFRKQAALSLQHLWRIGKEMEVRWWMGTVAFIVGEEHLQERALMAWKMWKKIHEPPLEGAEDEDQLDEPDAWDKQYGGQGYYSTGETSEHSLPDFDALLAHQSWDTLVPGFFAVQVAEIPRGCQIEWQSSGLAHSEVIIEAIPILPTTYLAEALKPLPDKRILPQDDMQDVAQPFQSVISNETERSSLKPRLSRSPHPYHRRSVDLINQGRYGGGEYLNNDQAHLHPLRSATTCTYKDIYNTRPGFFDADARKRRKISTSPSESGTEADDEGGELLKGLPAPPRRLRKGLKGRESRGSDRAHSPLLTPSLLNDEQWHFTAGGTLKKKGSFRKLENEEERRKVRTKVLKQRRAEILRRVLEAACLAIVGYITMYGASIAPVVHEDLWKPSRPNLEVALSNLRLRQLAAHGIVVVTVYLTYPARLVGHLIRNGSPLTTLRIPASFDPAPLLYPVLLPVFAAITLSTVNPHFMIPNLVLSICSIPSAMIPLYDHGLQTAHWILSLIPLIIYPSLNSNTSTSLNLYALKRQLGEKSNELEMLLLLLPLHKALVSSLEFLTTTSLLPAELQLLSVTLINLLLFSTSPQAVILKALLWIGGLSLFMLCRYTLRWTVAMARIPSWRFRQPKHRSKRSSLLFSAINDSTGGRLGSLWSSKHQGDSSDDNLLDSPLFTSKRQNTRHHRAGSEVFHDPDVVRIKTVIDEGYQVEAPDPERSRQRRYTLPTYIELPPGQLILQKSKPDLPARSRSTKTRRSAFLWLTSAQARLLTWFLAFYTYIIVAAAIFIPIRSYIAYRALSAHEPVGWALGYLFGDIPTFRFWTVMANVEFWICLPPRLQLDSTSLGLAEALQQVTIGLANTRLLISAYFLGIIIIGLFIVFRLSTVVEVDTRRKIFHGMMVAMLLPTTFIDPNFAALALALILAIFLLLDLFRASQLPPVSRPLTYFLAPYVDGRDHRGPVIVSHIFLLIGCAIPLWLSLAATERTGMEPFDGWDVVTRDLSMISGVVCVGMGDAAASLIGRRYGRRRWMWSGGKSLEGSIAFALAVVVGLSAARLWLLIGGWEGDRGDSWPLTLVKAIIAASGASFTEAVLTGGNDNVVVPVILWLLVRGLRM